MESPFNRSFQREQKRQAILSEAAYLFNVQGTRGTTLADIAERLGLNKTTLYYYVESKEELIYLCYLASCARIDAMLDEANGAGGSGSERLSAFIRAYFRTWKDVVLSHEPHYAILTEIRALKTGHRSEVAERYSGLFKKVRAIISDGMEDGSVAEGHVTDIALAVFGLVQLSVLWLPHAKPQDMDRMAEQFIDVVLNGIAIGDDFSPGEIPGMGQAQAGFDREARKLQKQEAFYRAGSAIFNRKGFKGTSLDEIADSLEVTKGAFYYHIKDKEELLYNCFSRSLEMIARMQELASGRAGSGLEELRLCSHYLFRVQNGAEGPLIRFNLIPSLSPEHKREIIDGINRVSHRFGEMISKGIGDGSIRAVDPFVAEQMLNAAINVCGELQWVRTVDDLDAAYQSFFRFFFTGIRKS